MLAKLELEIKKKKNDKLKPNKEKEPFSISKTIKNNWKDKFILMER